MSIQKVSDHTQDSGRNSVIMCLLITWFSLILFITFAHICMSLRHWCCVISVPTPSTSTTSTTSQPTSTNTSSSANSSSTSKPTSTTSQPSPLFDYQIIIIAVVCGVLLVVIVIVVVVVCYRRRNKPGRSGNSHMVKQTVVTDNTKV